MRRVHAWDKGKARVINALTYQSKTIRKPKKIGKPDQKREHCPFRNCKSFVYSLLHHIKKCHGTSKIINITPSTFYKKVEEEQRLVKEAANMEVDEFSDKISPLNNQVSPCVEKQSATNERDVYKIIDNMRMTPDIDFESLQKAFTKNSKHHIPEEIFDLFKQFRMWRMGPGGAQVEGFTAEMAQQKLETMARGMKVTKLSDFWDHRVLWKYFFYKKQSDEWAGTTGFVLLCMGWHYICTAKYFLVFLRRQIDLPEKENREISSMIDDFPEWSKCYRNLCKRQSMDKKLAAQKLLNTPDRYLSYQNSVEYRDAIKYLAESEENEDAVVTQKTFLAVRDMLIFAINVKNGNRAGFIAHMTVQDFNERKKSHDRDTGEVSFLVTVKSNKTYNDFGHGRVVLTTMLHHEMEVYLKNFRSFAMSGVTDHGYFFCTRNGFSLVDSDCLYVDSRCFLLKL